jgi:RNA polymerase sigma-70 factor (ECF subfamily)
MTFRPASDVAPEDDNLRDQTHRAEPTKGGVRGVVADGDLLAQIGRGSDAAFRELASRHGRYLFGIAYSMSGNTADAEDIVQETFLAVLKAKFRGESKVRTWLVGILVRQAAMLRRGKRRGVLSIFGSGTEPSDVHEPVASATADSADARMDVAAMLKGLSAEHREVIVLRELQGMSYDEMAATLGVPRGTVESRLHRARDELRKRFGGYLK